MLRQGHDRVLQVGGGWTARPAGDDPAACVRNRRVGVGEHVIDWPCRRCTLNRISLRRQALAVHTG